jgi:hypothetical protein
MFSTAYGNMNDLVQKNFVVNNKKTWEISHAVLAQLVERVAFNHVVVGSIPTDGGIPVSSIWV